MSKYSNEVIENFMELIDIVKREGDDSGLTIDQVYTMMDYISPDIRIEIVEKFLTDDGLVEVTIYKDKTKTDSVKERLGLIKELRNFRSFDVSVKMGVDIHEYIETDGEYTLPFKTTIDEKRIFRKNVSSLGFEVI